MEFLVLPTMLIAIVLVISFWPRKVPEYEKPKVIDVHTDEDEHTTWEETKFDNGMIRKVISAKPGNETGRPGVEWWFHCPGYNRVRTGEPCNWESWL